MLKLTQLIGFGTGGGGTDATPDAIDFNDISDSGFVASAFTNVVTISGIDTTITLRLTLTVAMSSVRTVDIYRNGSYVGSGTSGTTVDVAMTNGQTLQYAFTNAQDNTTWSGTATVTNLSDGGATLDTFTYTLIDTGSDPVGGVGGGPVGGPIP
jgi:hypothetical protein